MIDKAVLPKNYHRSIIKVSCLFFVTILFATCAWGLHFECMGLAESLQMVVRCNCRCCFDGYMGNYDR